MKTKGWGQILCFFRRFSLEEHECVFQLRSKVHLAKYLSPSVFKSRYLRSFLQEYVSAFNREFLNQKCSPFHFIPVDLFLPKLPRAFWNPCSLLACTNPASRIPTVQTHATAKNHCLSFKPATCCFHLIFPFFSTGKCSFIPLAFVRPLFYVSYQYFKEYESGDKSLRI